MQQLVQVLVDVLLDVVPEGKAVAPQMVGGTVEDVVPDSLAAKLSVRHRRCQDTMMKAMVAANRRRCHSSQTGHRK